METTCTKSQAEFFVLGLKIFRKVQQKSLFTVQSTGKVTTDSVSDSDWIHQISFRWFFDYV